MRPVEEFQGAIEKTFDKSLAPKSMAGIPFFARPKSTCPISSAMST